MRIEVLTEDDISPQARPYAEYRVFAALSRHVDIEQVRDARVVLRRANGTHQRGRVSCSVTVDLRDADPVRISSVGAHAYAAINRAVERLAAVRTTCG